MTDSVKTCISCRHFKEGASVYQPHLPQTEPQPECESPKAHSRDMIYGKAYARSERNDNKGCGKQGKLWEASKNNANNA